MQELNSSTLPFVLPDKLPNPNKKIDLPGDDASAVSNNRKLSNVSLTSKEEDST